MSEHRQRLDLAKRVFWPSLATVLAIVVPLAVLQE